MPTQDYCEQLSYWLFAAGQHLVPHTVQNELCRGVSKTTGGCLHHTQSKTAGLVNPNIFTRLNLTTRCLLATATTSANDFRSSVKFYYKPVKFYFLLWYTGLEIQKPFFLSSVSL
jgi:hypothetical protein